MLTANIYFYVYQYKYTTGMLETQELYTTAFIPSSVNVTFLMPECFRMTYNS